MYIAMNRFKVAKGREDRVRRDVDEPGLLFARNTRLHRVSPAARPRARGSPAVYLALHLGSYEAFQNWTRSEAFRKAHANAGSMPEGLTLAAPAFEGFEVVGEVKSQD